MNENPSKLEDRHGWGRFAWRAFGISLLVLLVTLGIGLFVASPVAHAPRAVPAQSSGPEAPADAPHFPNVELARPAPPASFAHVDRGWITFDYPPASHAHVQPLISEADRIRSEFRDRFGRDVLGSVAVRIADTARDMVDLAPQGAPYPSYASGVAYSQIGLVLLMIHPEDSGVEHNLLEVFRHELAHVALYDAVNGESVPRWFNEGFAIHLSGESSLSRVRTLWGATIAGKLIPITDLDRAFFTSPERASLAYAESADIVRHLLRTRDTQRFMKMLRQVSEGKDFPRALNDAFSLDLAGLEYEWREQAEARYSIWPVLLSGSLVWVGTLALFAFGWQRRRRRQEVVLERWRVEEASEDLRQKELLRLQTEARLHILQAPKSDASPPSPPSTDSAQGSAPNPASSPGQSMPVPSSAVVPKVEHDGNWHTLH
jgi:hypothetical protein